MTSAIVALSSKGIMRITFTMDEPGSVNAIPLSLPSNRQKKKRNYSLLPVLLFTIPLN
jgi:hypothetical protein